VVGPVDLAVAVEAAKARVRRELQRGRLR